MSPKYTAYFAAPVPLTRRHAWSGAHARFRVERPIDAARRRVERIDIADVAADVEAPAGHRRLSEDRISVRKSESPFQLQFGNVHRRQSGILGRCETRVARGRGSSRSTPLQRRGPPGAGWSGSDWTWIRRCRNGFASSGRPPRYSAMSRFWSAVSFWAGTSHGPGGHAAYTDSGVNSIKAFRSGARSTRLGPAWQEAQFWLNSVCPGDVGRGEGPCA